MAKAIKVRDLTLCDEREPFSLGHLTPENLRELLPLYRDARFYILEVWREGLTDLSERSIDETVWNRLNMCDRELKGISLLAVLSNVLTLLGDGSHPTVDLDEACRTAFRNGLDVVRITDQENDLNLLGRATRKVMELGGIPDAALCFQLDPEEETTVEEVVKKKRSLFSRLFGSEEIHRKVEVKKVHTDEYYVRRALELEKQGAKIITLDDRQGLMTPRRMFALMPKLKIALKAEVDVCVPSISPGVALGCVVTAIIKGVDIIDTSIWGYGGPTGGPSIELVSIFCEKMGIRLAVDMKAIGEIRKEMAGIGSAMRPTAPAGAGEARLWSDGFTELYEKMPREIDREFDRAIEAAGVNDEQALLDACRAIESYFGFA